MLKILQARLQQYVSREIPDVQAEFQRSRGIRDQIANIHWIVQKSREFQKNIYSAPLQMDKRNFMNSWALFLRVVKKPLFV